MGLAPWNVDWLNANSQRSYPLADSATGIDSSGVFEVPTDLLVDLVVTIPAAVVAATDPDKFHLLTLASFGGGIVVTLGYDGAPVASVAISSFTHVQNKAYAFVGQGDDFYDVQGTLVVGTLATVEQRPGGVYTFTVAAGQLATTVLRPSLRGVSSLAVVTSSGTSVPLVGDIKLVAGRNFRLVASPLAGEIRMDCLAQDTELSESCGCADPLLGLTPIKSINMVTPDAQGNINLVGDACLQVSGGASQITLDDLCSAPCCGCEELAVLQAAIQALFQQEEQMNSQISRLEVAMANFRDNVLAADLGAGSACPPE